ncbi:CHAD domain-containing protein [Streptomyces sp. M41]|uniref:CHAD domain-containing protein n=1 Tax=Streptomyces sp. M41 TaxID=3059412 RepID=UPI00374D59B5
MPTTGGSSAGAADPSPAGGAGRATSRRAVGTTSAPAERATAGPPDAAAGSRSGAATAARPGTDAVRHADAATGTHITGADADRADTHTADTTTGRTDAATTKRPGVTTLTRTDATAANPADAPAGPRAPGAAALVRKADAGHGSGPVAHAAPAPAPDRGNLTVGAAKAGALLERQLTLARTRAHSTALQALGSSRFHAVADSIAVLASEVPLTPAAADADLRPLAAAAEERLTDAVAALPLVTAGHPYNAEALIHGLSPDPAPHPQDAPWHQVRLLLRLHRYAREVLDGDDAPVDVRLSASGQALDRHRDASEAAAAAAQAARTPRIAPATAYALGVLHADQRHEVEAARFAFQQSWQMQTVPMP